MKKYEDYQTVSSLWVNSLPTHWEFNKLRSIFWQRKEKNDPVKTKEILSLSAKAGVELYSQKAHGGGNKAKDDITKYNIAHKGDLIVNCMNVISGSVGLSKYYGAISPVYYALVTRNEKFNRDYYHYVFKIEPFQKSLLPLGRGILMHESSTGKLNTIRMRISMSDFNNVNLPVPPRDEQDQIVRYLDWQVSKINHLIHGYQKQIKLLKERRQTIIDRATTQGINENATYKSSGVNWIDNIPTHWNMVYAKKLFAQRKDKAFPNDIQLTSSQKYGIISQEEFMKLEGRRLTVVMTGEDILKHVGIGDFVISMRSFQGGLEYSYIEGKISSAYVMLIPNKEKVYDEYFKWLLKSKPYIKALQGTSDLVRDGQALRYANFAKVYLPEIPMDEQKEIAEYIATEVAKIDNALPTFQKEIELLREYRTRLISDVVTGQIDVRDVVIPEYTPEEDTEIDTDDAGEDMEEVAEDAE